MTPELETAFGITFNEDSKITGSMKGRLLVEAAGHDEMDLLISVMTPDEHGD